MTPFRNFFPPGSISFLTGFSFCLIQNYLRERRFQNAFHDDLWNAMTNVSC